MSVFYHLPGLFEFYDLYKAFLPLFREHREYFYEWCEIGSIYGAPSDCLWGGGRVGFGDADPDEVFLALVDRAQQLLGRFVHRDIGLDDSKLSFWK